MISHLLIIFNIFSTFSTCSVKAFLSLSWGGEAGVSISFIGKWEGKGNKREKWEEREIREGNEREREMREGNEREREN